MGAVPCWFCRTAGAMQAVGWSMRSARALLFLPSFGFLAVIQQAAAAVNIDGGRSQLPGMKQDMFDQAQQKKNMGNKKQQKGPPDCPKSDGMSPFWGFTFVNGRCQSHSAHQCFQDMRACWGVEEAYCRATE